MSTPAKRDATEGGNDDVEADRTKKQRKSRWGQTAADVGGGPAATSAAAAVKPSVVGSMDVAAAALAAREALEKAKKAALFQQRIQAQLSTLKAAGGALAQAATPGLAGTLNMGAGATVGVPARKLLLDKYGREIDASGKVVPIKARVVSTLKVNLNKEKEARLKTIFKAKKPDRSLVDPEKNPYFDPSIDITKTQRSRKSFKFVEEGAYVKKEQQMARRAHAKALGIDLHKLKEDKTRVEKGQQEDDGLNPNLVTLGGGDVARTQMKLRPRDVIPDVEWWDKPLLASSMTEAPLEADLTSFIDKAKVTHYVEHPVPIEVGESHAVMSGDMYLTPKERRRYQKKRRQEKEKDKQDQIKMGLMAPPPPKVKLSNLMRVLGDSAVAEPSTVEKQVRNQMAQRMKDHEARNEARKLGPEARSKKQSAKWEHCAQVGEAHAAVFCVKELANKQNTFKVDKNAQQYHLTGCCLTCPSVGCVIAVEGNPRSVKRYSRLLLRRIKWVDADGMPTTTGTAGGTAREDDDEGGPEASANNFCRLVWRGVIKQPFF